VQDDGAPAVRATIESALDYGQQTPDGGPHTSPVTASANQTLPRFMPAADGALQRPAITAIGWPTCGDWIGHARQRPAEHSHAKLIFIKTHEWRAAHLALTSAREALAAMPARPSRASLSSKRGSAMTRHSGTHPRGLCAGVAALCALWITTPVGAQPSRGERVVIEYVKPVEPAHNALHDMLREHKTLELVRDLLTPVRWPRALRLELKGCDGVANAWYSDAVVTVCYEYVEEMSKSANAAARPAAITAMDSFTGSLADVFLHEAAHALFDMLKIPVLGREEDAADHLSAYHVLQLPDEVKRRMLLGGAWTYANELKIRRPRDLYRRRLEISRHVTFSDEHGTPAQRLYNLLCIAYGSDKQLFADVVEKGFLPQERAEFCEDEYRQVDFAYKTLVAPHVEAVRRP
jgi:hypothetical protein